MGKVKILSPPLLADTLTLFQLGGRLRQDLNLNIFRRACFLEEAADLSL